MKQDHLQTGAHGEQAVARYLKQQKFTIHTTNFMVRGGEIDLIAQKNDLVLFVEVKTRKNCLVDPAEVITHTKQKRILKAAHCYLAQHSSLADNATCRFDVALVTFDTDAQPVISYIPDAFQESGW